MVKRAAEEVWDDEARKAFAVRLGQLLSQARQNAGLTQQEAASRLGVDSFATISRFERGAVVPTLFRLAQLADAYDVPIERLIAGKPGRASGPVDDTVALLKTLPRKEQEMIRTIVEQAVAALNAARKKPHR